MSMATLKSALKSVLTQGGGIAGGALASRMGYSPSVGANLGSSMGGRISRMIGSGDYTSSIVNPLVKGGVGATSMFPGTRSIDFSHHEYIGELFAGPTANIFNNTSYAINPGLSALFPFGSNLADNFEEYEFKSLVFQFRSTTSPYNSSSAMGTVMISRNDNPLAQPFTSKIQMENSGEAVSGRPDEDLTYGIECEGKQANKLFTRKQMESPLTSYDFGTLQIATQTPAGIAAGSSLGEIWAAYRVVLSKPRVNLTRYGAYHLSGIFAVLAGGAGGFSSLVNGTATGAFSSVTATAATTSILNITINNVVQGDVYCLTVSAYDQAVGNTLDLTCNLSSGLVSFIGMCSLTSPNGSSTIDSTNAVVVTNTQTVLTKYATVTGANNSSQTFGLNFNPSGGANSSSSYFDVTIYYVGNGITSAGF